MQKPKKHKNENSVKPYIKKHKMQKRKNVKTQKRKLTAESFRFISIQPVNLNSVLEIPFIHLIPYKLPCCWNCGIIHKDNYHQR
jgi:hypothetical protein